MPSYRHRVPAGRGLVVGPGRRRQPSTCWINKVTCLALFLWMRLIGMAITKGIVIIVPLRPQASVKASNLKAQASGTPMDICPEAVFNDKGSDLAIPTEQGHLSYHAVAGRNTQKPKRLERH